MSKINYRFMSESYMDWLRSITFLKQELDILKVRLWATGLSSADNNLKKRFDRFEREFTEHMKRLHHLQSSILRQLSAMQGHAATAVVSVEDKGVEMDFHMLKSGFELEERAVNALRSEFADFCVVSPSVVS